MENTSLINLEYVNTIVRERPEEIHKGQCGRVLIVAGSVGMAGAAVLSSRGALKSGAGLVKIAAPIDIFDILQIAVPQATCMDAAELMKDTDTSISEGGPEGLLDIYDAVAIGPGLGVDENRYLLIKHILKHYNGTVVLDADGINCICRYDMGLQCLKDREEPVILTPHVGEADRLLTALGEEKVKDIGRKKAAEIISSRTGAVVLLKGAGTIVTEICRAEEKVPSDKPVTYTNTTGNAGMATGGSGDVLTGVIAALAGYGVDPFDAASAGAYMHGLAGDIAAEIYGQWGMTAAEIAEALPAAFKEVVGK